MRNWLRFLSVIAIFVAVLGSFVYFSSDWFDDQDPPNYSQIEDGLYMGGDSPKPPRGADAVLNLCENPDPYQAEVHRWEPIPDTAPAPSLNWLRQQVEFVSSQRQAGRTVFVHCHAGISRSGMVVTAYLMAREGWSRDVALAHVRSKRPEAQPNPAFMELLLDWEVAVKGGAVKIK
jgi:hypothetical protein